MDDAVFKISKLRLPMIILFLMLVSKARSIDRSILERTYAGEFGGR
jgi:hypothetical protein